MKSVPEKSASRMIPSWKDISSTNRLKETIRSFLFCRLTCYRLIADIIHALIFCGNVVIFLALTLMW